MGSGSNPLWDQLGVPQQQGMGNMFSNLFGYLGGLGSISSGGLGNFQWGEGYGPDADGWLGYIGHPPPEGALCQFYQDIDDAPEPWVGYKSDLRPELNVAYLKWRLTGIAKESL